METHDPHDIKRVEGGKELYQKWNQQMRKVTYVDGSVSKTVNGELLWG